MTWHTATVATDRMAALLATIRSTGGTVTHCQPQTGVVRLTWTTPTRSDHRQSPGQPDAARTESAPSSSATQG